MPRVLITRILPPPAYDNLIAAGFDVDVWQGEKPMTAAELVEKAQGVDALLSLGADQITDQFLSQCPRLRIVSQFAVGYDNIDVPAATRRGIPVGNTPEVLSEATADIAFALMIAVSRKLFYHHKRIERGEWNYFEPSLDLGMELYGKTLGIFGLGRIGMVMAQRCAGAYNMPVIYYNRSRNEQAEKKLKARWVSFEELLNSSDVLSVHSVLSNETRGLFNNDVFSKMKPTSIFINTSRGGVHNESDLLEALQEKIIWGAGLDVTNPEPMHRDNPLLQMSNVAILPHIGSGTQEARTEMSRRASENIVSFFKSGKVPYIVNPEVLSRG